MFWRIVQQIATFVRNPRGGPLTLQFLTGAVECGTWETKKSQDWRKALRWEPGVACRFAALQLGDCVGCFVCPSTSYIRGRKIVWRCIHEIKLLRAKCCSFFFCFNLKLCKKMSNKTIFGIWKSWLLNLNTLLTILMQFSLEQLRN